MCEHPDKTTLTCQWAIQKILQFMASCTRKGEAHREASVQRKTLVTCLYKNMIWEKDFHFIYWQISLLEQRTKQDCMP
jgi:hypothetical protein